MVFSNEQAGEIKKQIIGQIEGSQMENKDEIIESINGMNEVELEGFLKQNNIKISDSGGLEQSSKPDVSSGSSSGSGASSGCVFCSIAKGEMSSYKINENAKAIAILELNPVSEGHSIVVPLEHVSIEKLPKSVMSLAQKVAKKIKIKLKSEDVKIESSSLQGHAFVNVIPLYRDVAFEKKKASESELKKLQKKLEIKKRGKRVVKSKKVEEGDGLKGLVKVGFRIP